MFLIRRMIEHYLSCLPQDLRLNENLKGLSLTFDSKDSSDSLITYVEIPAETDGKVVHDLLVEALFSINGRTDGLNFIATPMLGREQ